MTEPTRHGRLIHTAETFYVSREIEQAVPRRTMRLAQQVADPERPNPKPAELCWRLFGPEVEPPKDDQVAGEIVAYVNEARWVTDCPDRRCNAAQVVSPSDPRFLCAVCGNLANRRRWYRVKFPSANVRRQIEGLIARRPRLENVNWTPDESVAQVRRLNRDHGISDEVA